MRAADREKRGRTPVSGAISAVELLSRIREAAAFAEAERPAK